MPTARSDRVYELWFDADSKFEFYLTGLTVTMIAYWGKGFVAPRALLSPETLRVIGLASLLVSAFLALKRMERAVQVLRLNSHSLHLSEKAQAHEEASARPGLSKEMVTGRIISPQNAANRAAHLRSQSQIVNSHIGKLRPSAKSLYKWRNRTLICGIALYLGSRLWPST